jgi:hypothetical protein
MSSDLEIRLTLASIFPVNGASKSGGTKFLKRGCVVQQFYACLVVWERIEMVLIER